MCLAGAGGAQLPSTGFTSYRPSEGKSQLPPPWPQASLPHLLPHILLTRLLPHQFALFSSQTKLCSVLSLGICSSFCLKHSSLEPSGGCHPAFLPAGPWRSPCREALSQCLLFSLSPIRFDYFWSSCHSEIILSIFHSPHLSYTLGRESPRGGLVMCGSDLGVSHSTHTEQTSVGTAERRACSSAGGLARAPGRLLSQSSRLLFLTPREASGPGDLLGSHALPTSPPCLTAPRRQPPLDPQGLALSCRTLWGPGLGPADL